MAGNDGMDDGGLDIPLLEMMDRGFRELRKKMDRDAEAAALSRKGVYETLAQHGRMLERLDRRLEAVEQWAPTLEEFREYKRHVRAAGRLGKWLWRLGGVILACAVALYAARQEIAELWARLMR